MRLFTFAACSSAVFLAAAPSFADPPAAPAAPATDAPAAAPAATPAPAPAAADTSTSGHELVAPSAGERTANNALYIEGLGPALFYSVNYERAFGDFAARIGFGYVSISASATSADGTSGASASASFLSVPITVSYLGIGSGRNTLELGAGATIFHVGAGGSAFDSSSSSSSSGGATYVLPAAIVGYRFQPLDGGFVFRAGLAPIFGGGSLPVLPWPYLALGGAFGA